MTHNLRPAGKPEIAGCRALMVERFGTGIGCVALSLWPEPRR